MDGQKCAVDPATDQKVADDWCDNTCRSTPDADWCKGVCICPKLKPAAKPSVTPAANNPASKPAGCRPSQKGTEQKVSNEWCESTCRAAPDVDWCKDVCICPPLKPTRDHARAGRPEPPPPHPRILGGWTDCGPNSGESDMAQMQRRSTEKLRVHDRKWGNGGNGAGKRLDKFNNCSM